MDKSNEELRAVFDDFDKDGNGYLDAGEIVVAAG
jgi:Ca2+-binding EF-hand superfamily protein